MSQLFSGSVTHENVASGDLGVLKLRRVFGVSESVQVALRCTGLCIFRPHCGLVCVCEMMSVCGGGA